MKIPEKTVFKLIYISLWLKKGFSFVQNIFLESCLYQKANGKTKNEIQS